jgi:hypothetical protein
MVLAKFGITTNFGLKVEYDFCIEATIYSLVKKDRDVTVCFTDLDQGTKMIILKSIMITSIASIIFRGDNIGNWLKLKIEFSELSMHKSVKHICRCLIMKTNQCSL